jgi:hypothetical protein
MRVTIFDLDNCISNDEHRIGLIDWSKPIPDRYALYHAACGLDRPAHVDVVSRAENPVFLTARPVSMRGLTLLWLAEHFGLERPTLLMRNDNDTSPSVNLKAGQVAVLFAEYGVTDVAMAYDDREDVVQMYRELSINAARLWIHDTCAYKSPVETPRRRAPDLLEAGASTFRERNAVYGDNYLQWGAICAAMFPDGITIPASDEQAFNRLGVFVQCLHKLTRYASTFNAGGHQDSAHDLMVYAAMLEELTK